MKIRVGPPLAQPMAVGALAPDPPNLAGTALAREKTPFDEIDLGALDRPIGQSAAD